MGNQLIEGQKQVASRHCRRETPGQASRGRGRQGRRVGAAGDDGHPRWRRCPRQGALQRKKEHDGLAATYQDQWSQAEEAGRPAEARPQGAEQQDRGGQASRSRCSSPPAARLRRRRRSKRPWAGLNNSSAFETFDRMKEKVEQMEAEADAAPKWRRRPATPWRTSSAELEVQPGRRRRARRA